ncbi:MAG: DNA-processing protein DprA [Magnetospirillum sp. WYHS-4]
MSESRGPELSDSIKLDWLRLIRSENVGPVTFFRLLERFGTAAAALKALPELARRGGRAERIKVCSPADAKKEFEALIGLGGCWVAAGEQDYPPLLAQVEDPPPLLAVLGHPHLLRKRAVAVVGSRNASLNGCRLAQRIAADLGQGGLLVVSGLARGIDAAAHEGALATGTVGVVGGGVDVVYPKENAKLYERLVAEGAIVAEAPVGTQPLASHFPRRNRIISGMARGVVVVEAGKRSGSLITARMAGEQGREVFAVPGSPLDPRSAGTNDLIRQGAVLTESAEDVLAALKPLMATPLKERKRMEVRDLFAKPPAEAEVESARRRIESLLNTTAIEVDEIVAACQLPVAVVLSALLELELAGRLERHPGNRVSILRSA